MATVMPNHKKRPEHGTLCCPVSGPEKRVLDSEGAGSKTRYDCHVPCEVGERPERVLLEALRGDRVADIFKGEGWLRAKVEAHILRWLWDMRHTKWYTL